jgi:hypothetical protein
VIITFVAKNCLNRPRIRWKAGWPGANPTIVIYNASAVEIYNSTGSLVRFENKYFLFTDENALVYFNAVVVNYEAVGLAP